MHPCGRLRYASASANAPPGQNEKIAIAAASPMLSPVFISRVVSIFPMPIVFALKFTFMKSLVRVDEFAVLVDVGAVADGRRDAARLYEPDRVVPVLVEVGGG